MIYIHWIALTAYVALTAAVIMRILMDKRQPAKTLAWILVLVFVPLAGTALYLFFGRNTRKMRYISRHSLDQITRRSLLGSARQHELHVPEPLRRLVQMLATQSEAMPFKDNEVQVFTDGHSLFAALLKAIARARVHIHITTYIFDDDPLGRLVADALIAKAREGVEVRVIYDDVGCWRTPRKFFERMREEGVDIRAFMPAKLPMFTSKVNYRNHRKLCVIDGTTGFIGGMNIALRYVKGENGQPWRDTHMQVRGAAVYGLQAAFLVDWFFVDRTLVSGRKYYPPIDPLVSNNCIAQVVTGSPAAPWPDIMNAYVRILLEAKRYVYIETPYFLPTEPVILAIRTAALAGVDVRVMVPRQCDSHVMDTASMSYLADIVDAGAKALLYEGGFNHSKLLVADDIVSTCGSANVDARSFENNFEANIFFYDREVAVRIKEIFLADAAKSTDFLYVRKDEAHALGHRLAESLIRLFSPLL